MRLIDADEYKGKYICNHLYSGVTKLIEVDAVPTAFDLKSVIEEFEDKFKRAELQLEVANDFEDKNLNDILFFTERKERYEEILEKLKSAINVN